MQKRTNVFFAVSSLVLLSLTLCQPDEATAQTGIVSIYSGQRTANGEYAHKHKMTAAHRSLPFRTKVRVTNHRNGRSVVVRINDRGPYVPGRVIDLTPSRSSCLETNDGPGHIMFRKSASRALFLSLAQRQLEQR